MLISLTKPPKPTNPHIPTTTVELSIDDSVHTILLQRFIIIPLIINKLIACHQSHYFFTHIFEH